MAQDDREHAELVMLYAQATQDVRTFQDRQSHVTNLAMLIFAGMVAIGTRLPSSAGSWINPSTTALIAALGAATWLGFLQCAIRRARRKLDDASKHFSVASRQVCGEKPEPSFLEFWDVFVLLIGAVILGLVITLKILGPMRGGA